MSQNKNRRVFLKQAGALSAGVALGAGLGAQADHHEMKKYTFDISLAGWSLHRSLGEGANKKPAADMPQIAKDEYGIDAVELVSQMLASDSPEYIAKIGANAEKAGVKIILVMIDGQGNLGAAGADERAAAVTKHKHWMDIAKSLGCHTVRMNWGGQPSDFLTNKAACDDLIARSAPTYIELAEYGDSQGLNISIENHWGPSSYPDILTALIKKVDHPRMGTLPDFGNFPEEVDRYDAIDAMMPYAKAVSAKCHDFDADSGLETKTDFPRMMEIVCGKHGYKGHVGIEYEGGRLSESDGIKACKALLEKMRA